MIATGVYFRPLARETRVGGAEGSLLLYIYTRHIIRQGKTVKQNVFRRTKPILRYLR